MLAIQAKLSLERESFPLQIFPSLDFDNQIDQFYYYYAAAAAAMSLP